jgi:hypothetical protein
MDPLPLNIRNRPNNTRRNTRKPIEYIVVSGSIETSNRNDPFKRFNMKVMEKINNGYVLHGGIAVTNSGTLYQVLLKL